MPDRAWPLTFAEPGPVLRLPGHAPAAGAVAIDRGVVTGPWKHDGHHWQHQLGRCSLRVRMTGPGAWRLTITNTGDMPEPVNSVVFPRFGVGAFEPRLASEPYSELIHGGSFLGMASGVKRVGRRSGRLDFLTPSAMLTVYHHDDGRAFLLGVLPPLGGAFCTFHDLHSHPHLEGDFGFEIRHEFGVLLKPGQTVATSTLIALAQGEANDLLAQYGGRWRDSGQARAARTVQVGWNSWDYYAGAVTRQALDENIVETQKLFNGVPRTICIDEGWETQWGTWEPNRKFAAGLKDFADACRRRNLTPGIWTAPLLVNTYNPLFYDKADWFASRADGQLQTDSYAYGPMAYLDVTRPDVREHLADLFRRLRELGFEYFKVDFTHCILKADRFHDPSVPRADLIRSAFQVIRAAIGETAYLLGCGAPYESVFGLVDAVRTTGDIHTYWSHVLMNAGAMAARWWMQGRMWNTDPDFLVVRGAETARPPYFKRRVINPMPPDGAWLAGREFNLDEAKAYALLVHLSGGEVMLGDRLKLLREAGIEVIRRVLQPRAPAVPADLFTSDQQLPRLWISRDQANILVAYFNWTDRPARIHLDLQRLGLPNRPVDFWSGKPLQSLPGMMRRRSALALVFD